MMFQNRGIYSFWGATWVLISQAPPDTTLCTAKTRSDTSAALGACFTQDGDGVGICGLSRFRLRLLRIISKRAPPMVRFGCGWGRKRTLCELGVAPAPSKCPPGLVKVVAEPGTGVTSAFTFETRLIRPCPDIAMVLCCTYTLRMWHRGSVQLYDCRLRREGVEQ